MSTAAHDVTYQSGMHVNPLVSITSELGADIQQLLKNIDFAKLLHFYLAREIHQLLVF